MRAVVFAALAVLLAAVASAQGDAFCVMQTEVNNKTVQVNLTGTPAFQKTEYVLLPEGRQSTFIGVSTCVKRQLAATCNGYVYLSVGAMKACYDTVKSSVVNGTSNVTSLKFLPNATANSVLFMAGFEELTLTLRCDLNAFDDQLEYLRGSQTLLGAVTLEFASKLACPVPAPAPVPTTETPSTMAPVTTTGAAPKKDDDDSGISPWAIVGIVVGGVVVVVLIGVVIYKCRKSDAQSDGEYSRV